jgi:release factor glutamine methyltransferase
MTGDTIAQALQHACQAGLARIDAQLLMLHVLGRAPQDRAWLLAHDTDTLPALAAEKFATLCVHRQNGEPVAYLTGRKAFFGLDLAVDARVLDPRPDTETLVDWALDVLTHTTAPTVADLGTGSGAIALAIRHQRPDAHVVAVDASADALAVAQANADRLQLPVTCHLGHWLDPLPDGQQDLIVSNPPYIAEGDPHLAALRHEPIMALTSGPDGLDAIRHIVAGAPRALRPGGWLLLEHGYDQGDAVHTLLLSRGFVEVTSRRDLSDHVRCTGGRWLGDNSGDNPRF